MLIFYEIIHINVKNFIFLNDLSQRKLVVAQLKHTISSLKTLAVVR